VPVLSTVLEVGGIVTVELWVNVIVDRTVEELVDVVTVPAALLVGKLEVVGEELDSLLLRELEVAGEELDPLLLRELEEVGEELDSLLLGALEEVLGVEAEGEELDSLLVEVLDNVLEVEAEGVAELVSALEAAVLEATEVLCGLEAIEVLDVLETTEVLYVLGAVGESDEELGAVEVLYVLRAVGEGDEELGASLDLLDVVTEELLREKLGVAIMAEAGVDPLVAVVAEERLVG
jgi:hypothetical protein